MKSSCIDYLEAGSFLPAVTDYLDQDSKLKPYFDIPPTFDGFRALISKKKNTLDRNLLVKVLKEQYSRDGREKTEDGREKTEDGREKTEDGREKTEDGREKTEVGREKTEDGREKTEDGREKTEDGREKTEVGREKTEVGREKTEDGREKTEVGREKTEDGREKTEVGREKTEDGREKTEVGREKTEDGREKTEVGSQEPGAGSLVNQNIDLLLKENTYTVTTGHQLNIFTGPLYFIYKIVTTLKLAADLKQALPEYNFVPVYWMATEDHDFEEINHTTIGDRKLVWENHAKGATGRLSPGSMRQVIKAYQSSLGISANAGKLSSIIEKAYHGHSSLADATRFLVDALFGTYGLVILDADNKELKQQFASIIEQDIFEQNSFREITESSKSLQEIGYKTGVNAREINFFYLDKELRERIEYKDGSYYVLNTGLRFSKEELRKEINANPEKFSPNVVLRPLYEEIILPNLAYIGGGAEIAYWLQLKQLFNFYKVDFPILILRNSALLIDETIEAKLQKLDVTFRDIFKELEKLKKEWVVKHSEYDLTLAGEWKELEDTFEKIRSRSSKIDPTLAASTEAVKARLHKALSNLEKKLMRAEKRNHSVALSQIENIKNKLFPEGILQERTENFGLYYVKYGDEFIRELIEHFKPLDFKFTILC